MIHSTMKNSRINRRRYFFNNTVSSLILQVVNLLCGFILPKVILKSYGSETNGIVSTITQYLAFINFLDLGVGAVTQSAYYIPLSEKNSEKISAIYNESAVFFRKIALALIGYVILLCIILPKIIRNDYGEIYIVTLIIVLSFNQFAQFFFAIPDQLLLNASQRGYILNAAQIILVVLNTVLSVTMIYLGQGIHLVKLASAMVFFINPVILHYHVNKLFHVKRGEKIDGTHIPQKKNGFAQHCATVVMNNTDVAVLSIFSTLSNVSVYAVYNLVYAGIRQLFTTLSSSFTPLIGNVYTEEDNLKLNTYFNFFEWALHFLIVIVYTITGNLIVPFVMNYTRGVMDAKYSQPTFAIVMTIAFYVYCVRIPYISMVNAAGHFKQTQKSAVVEAIINILFSTILVYMYGLTGVAVGTLFAITYRTLYLCWYLKNNIIYRNPLYLLKNIVVDCIPVITSTILFQLLNSRLDLKPDNSYINWFVSALIAFIIVTSTSLGVNFVFYKKNLKLIWTRMIQKMRGKRGYTV